MSLVKQVGLLAAGCQPWNADVCAASGDRFAYCATLAVYIFQLDRKFNEFKLISIMSEHKKTITAISWNPKNVDLFATASSDNSVIIWNVAEQKIVSRLNNTRNAPCSIGWCLHEKDCVSFVYGKGPLFLWNYSTTNQVTPHKDAHNFMSEICQFRWHPKKTGKVAFGHNDGSVSLMCPGQKVWKHVLRPDDLEGTDEEDPVTALEWDPLSVEYLLITNTHYGVRLLDTEGVSVIMKFQLPSAAAQVHTLAWISSAPGMFVTGDSHSGVMRLWNVSKSTPIENIRLKKTGFHALHVFSTAPGRSNNITSDLDSPNSMSAMPASVSATSRYALPPAHAVCTFLDGGVGLYDLGRRKWSFLRDMGHIETIFDCKFKPDNPDHLATASFDGTIKIWDVNTLEPVTSSPGNEGIIYCLSWAPADLNCVAASTSKNGAFIWDITKGKVVKRFMEHNKSSVYSVAWNQKDSRRIATCGGDSYCIIRQVDGKLLMRYKHSGPVFGCEWSPHNKDMIATGCEDKMVRVFYMATTNEQPLKVFAGHQAKVFQVRWSPLREGLLCSGSDDQTIRIWDYTQDCCITVLSGHKGPVRGLLWSTELPYLLISGSWDYTIRVWDIRDGAEIDTILDHGADVYGLTIHPERPFTLASSSRDSTVRIWSITPLAQPLEINILAEKSWEEVLSNPENAVSQGAPPLLFGKASRDIKALLDKIQGKSRAHTLQMFSKFFSSPRGTNNLWELVSVILGMGDDYLSPGYCKGIMHMRHLTKYKAAEAQELEIVQMSKFGGGLGARSKEDRLREAANIHIRLGNLQKYCEILAELGEWDKAIAIAPGVSIHYWKSLAERRGKALIQEDSDDTIPYCAATGNAELLVRFFTSRGQLTDAMMAATSAYEGVMIPPEGGRKRGSKASSQNGMAGETEENLSLLKHTSEALADWHFRSGAPILAACCHLAVEDCQRAMCKLIRGNELELAVSMGLALGTVNQLTHWAARYLARRCERMGKWELGVDLIKAILPEPDLTLASICARCAASMAEINDLHHKAGFPSMDDCLIEAEKLATNAGGELQCIKYYLLSTTPEKGLEMGLTYAKAKLSSSGWQVDDIFDLLQLMGSIQTEKLQQHKCTKWRSELLVLCAYVGALVAVRRHYDSVVPALYRHTNQLMKKDEVDVPLSESLVSLELDAWLAHQAVQTCYDPSTPSRPDVAMTVEQQQTYQEVLRKAGEERGPVEVGPDVASGSQLPSHSDVHVSCITGHRIQGAGYFLEDGKSAISLNDALMWAKVNPFSPLGSGVRINPF